MGMDPEKGFDYRLNNYLERKLKSVLYLYEAHFWLIVKFIFYLERYGHCAVYHQDLKKIFVIAGIVNKSAKP